MKQRVKLTLLIACIVLFFGCSREEKAPPGSVLITLWTGSNPYEMKWAEAVVSEWNKRNPTIIVKTQPIPEGQSSEEILIASVIAKTSPDICANLSPIVVEQFRQAHALVCLNDQPRLFRAITERVPEDILRGFVSPDGRLYQVPWKGNPVLMFCNLKQYRDVGAPPPRTYSDWLKAAGAIRFRKPGDYITQFDPSIIWHKHLYDFYTLYIAASGGKTLFNEAKKVDINNSTAIQVLKFLRENYSRDYVPMQLIPGPAFLSERIASYISGSWNIASLSQEAPQVEYDVFPIPVPDGYDFREPVHTYADPKCIGIFSNTKHPAECAAFVQFMCSRENDALLVQTCYQLVYRKSLLGDELFEKAFRDTPKLRKFAEALPYVRSYDQSPCLLELFDALAMEYVDVVVRGIRSPEEGLKRAQARMEEITQGE